MKHLSVCYVFFILVTVCITDCVQPQEQVRRDLRTPGLVVETGAPTSKCWSLQFSADGTDLLAAGMDKVVRQWSITDNGFDLSEAKNFRWAAYREQRGTIFCTALSHDREQRYLAVAGWGLRNGAIAIIDRRSGEVLYGSKYQMGLQPIYAVAFSSTDDRIFYGTFDGSVGAWDFRTGNVDSVGRHNAARNGNPTWCVVPDPNNKASFISLAQDGSWFRWTQGNQTPETLPPFDMEVNYAAVSHDGTTVAVSGFRPRGNRYVVETRSIRPPQQSGWNIPIPNDVLPNSVALDVTGQTLAVVLIKGEEEISTIHLYDVESRQERGVVSEIKFADAVAFHPSGRILAFAGGIKDGITLWDIPGRRVLDTVESPGRLPFSVAFNQDAAVAGEMFIFWTNESQPAPHYFDLNTRNWARPSRIDEFQQVPTLETLDDWSLDADHDEDSKRIVYDVVNSRTNESLRIPIDPNTDFAPTCWTFLPKLPGETGVRLVVGHTWGASLFQVITGVAPKLLRRFVGHQGEVLDVAVSEDGRRLITVGRDQTIAGWSLDPWPNQSELGVDFMIRNGRLVVANVAPGSPGWEAKLEPGDEIIRLRYDVREVHGGPAAWQTVLQDPIPGKELVFNLRRTGQPDEIITLTTVRQRPLWKFFSTEDNEWVLWRWRDYYYDCSTKGDDSIGWQINTETDTTPMFIAAEQFRSRFYRPDKVAAILGRTFVPPERVADFEIRPPKLRLEAKKEGRSNNWKVSISAEKDRDQFCVPPREVSLWINDHKAKRWLRTSEDFSAEVTIDARHLREGDNFLLAQAYAENGVRGDSETHKIQKPLSRQLPRLFALGIGINDYSQSPSYGKVKNLEFCREDCEGILKVLRAQTSGRTAGAFQQGKIVSLTDKEATRENIVRAFQDLSAEMKPDDFFVLFMAGHGWADQSTKANDEYDPTTFALVTADFDLSAPEKTGLSFVHPLRAASSGTGQSLYDFLTGISSHKAVLLDCCHSGSVLGKDSDLIRSLIPERVGPTVLVACDKDELAWPSPDAGHGVFTTAVLGAFGVFFKQADTNGNAQLSCEELTEWVINRVPQMAQTGDQQRGGGLFRRLRSQHPRAFLPEIRPEHIYFQRVTGNEGK